MFLLIASWLWLDQTPPLDQHGRFGGQSQVSHHRNSPIVSPFPHQHRKPDEE